MLAVRLMELMPDLACASTPLGVRAQTQRSFLLLNSNTKMKQNAAWKQERAFPLSSRTPFKKGFFEQGAFPLSSRTPFKKEFFAFVDALNMWKSLHMRWKWKWIEWIINLLKILERCKVSRWKVCGWTVGLLVYWRGEPNWRVLTSGFLNASAAKTSTFSSR